MRRGEGVYEFIKKKGKEIQENFVLKSLRLLVLG